MAFYTNLAVDCSDNAPVAQCLFAIYDGLEVPTSEFGVIGCNVEHIKPHRHWGHPQKFNEHAGDWHTLCASPRGIGNAPLSESSMEELRHQLYEPLKQGFAFRSAWFGCEAQDSLLEMDWIETLDQINATGLAPNMIGLIVSKGLITNPDDISWLKPFCDGYLWYDPA